MTLLGQNVNSYAHEPPSTESPTGAEADEAGGSVGRRRRSTKGPAPPAAPPLRDGFRSKVQPARGSIRFAELMRSLCEEHPEVRFRFTSPHPKDFPDDLLHVLSELPNACLSLHIPAQSGSTKASPRPPLPKAPTSRHYVRSVLPRLHLLCCAKVLDAMRRGYSRDAYFALIDRVRELLPTASISSDFISGFCGETVRDRATCPRVHHVSTWQCAPRAHVPTTCPRGTGG